MGNIWEFSNKAVLFEMLGSTGQKCVSTSVLKALITTTVLPLLVEMMHRTEH
jgi:hypothetical protein